MTLHTNISLTMALFLSFLKMQPVNSPLLTSNWPLLLASNLNPDPVLCRNQKKVGEDLEFSPELNSCTNKNTFQLKLCVSQLSSSSCCGACTSATPCALYPLPSTNRAIWRRPSTTSSSAPPSSTSSGWSRAILFGHLSKTGKTCVKMHACLCNKDCHFLCPPLICLCWMLQD